MFGFSDPWREAGVEAFVLGVAIFCVSLALSYWAVRR